MVTFAFLGTTEIIVILIIALLVFGPQKLPEIGRQIGSAMREMRKMSADVQRALDFDDHGGYDRYEPPSYSYTPPTAPVHEPLDQYGLEDEPAAPKRIADAAAGGGSDEALAAQEAQASIGEAPPPQEDAPAVPEGEEEAPGAPVSAPAESTTAQEAVTTAAPVAAVGAKAP